MAQVFVRLPPAGSKLYLFVTVVVEGEIVSDAWILATSGRSKSNRLRKSLTPTGVPEVQSVS